jgi:hypothetical protein
MKLGFDLVKRGRKEGSNAGGGSKLVDLYGSYAAILRYYSMRARGVSHRSGCGGGGEVEVANKGGANICEGIDNWADFPESEDGALVGNLTYVFILGSFACGLYK